MNECCREREAVISDLKKAVQSFDTCLEVMESTANTLRGMTLDPAIPKHAKDCFWPLIAKLEGEVAMHV